MKRRPILFVIVLALAVVAAAIAAWVVWRTPPETPAGTAAKPDDA